LFHGIRKEKRLEDFVEFFVVRLFLKATFFFTTVGASFGMET